MSKPSIARRRAASRVRPSPRRAGALAAAPLVAVCAMLAACALPTHPESAAPPSDPFNPAATQLLDDTSWTLASWQTAGGATRQIAGAGAEGTKDATGGDREAAPTLVLSTATGERRASGFAGCNRFSGPYALKSGKLALGPLATTRMACSGSRGELEHAYLDALAHIAKTGVQWRTPHRLELVTEDGATLSFDAATR
ncbi:META domain-containing protein [Trinickia sp. EG282A]|uniref:META domain-containing protein n=1 Tax=Trinickia sp. EG282A TaxID=3237013 RepID=UPI0034D21D24